MATKWFQLVRVFLGFGLGAFLFIAIFSSCNGRDQKGKRDPLENAQSGMDTSSRTWKSWNILLKEGTSHQSASDAILSVENYILNYLKNINPDWRANFQVFFCPCDSLLYNLAAHPVDGVGQSVSPPAGGPQPPAPSGDILYVNLNNPLDQDDVYSRDYKLDSAKINLRPANEPSSKVLAIIDTGIDTTRLNSDMRKLIWQPPAGGLKLFNFLGGNPIDFKDDHPVKHGTAVAVLALNAISDGAYPQLMVLKALDKNKKGSTFTVSCALSYAIQNKADVINASLGYYEMQRNVDLILKEYLLKCDTVKPKRIYVFAAAGNLPGPHPSSAYCSHPGIGNELNPNRLFYPACFSDRMNHVISVTGLSDPRTGCFFQNYSKQFVTLGVLNQTGCCKFYVPFLAAGYEGSSFATPVATGMAMRLLISGTPDILDCINAIQQTAPSNPVTKNGHYIIYPGNPISF